MEAGQLAESDGCARQLSRKAVAQDAGKPQLRWEGASAPCLAAGAVGRRRRRRGVLAACPNHLSQLLVAPTSTALEGSPRSRSAEAAALAGKMVPLASNRRAAGRRDIADVTPWLQSGTSGV